MELIKTQMQVGGETSISGTIRNIGKFPYDQSIIPATIVPLVDCRSSVTKGAVNNPFLQKIQFVYVLRFIFKKAQHIFELQVT